jgi:hypothetical protein
MLPIHVQMVHERRTKFMHDPASDSNSDEIEEVEVVPPPKRPKKPTRKIPLSHASQMGGSSHGASSHRG